MSHTHVSPRLALDLPRELDDIAGLLDSDLRAIVQAVVVRADERLRLTRRQYAHLENTLWNRLVDSLNEVVQPLTAEAR